MSTLITYLKQINNLKIDKNPYNKGNFSIPSNIFSKDK